jgi:hypothetical protein
MKFLAMLLLAVTAPALAQQSAAPAAPAQLPIKIGEWKMTAIVHGKDTDTTHTFFTCVKDPDLATLVQKPENTSKTLACVEGPKQLTAQGVKLSLSCTGASATINTAYELTRSTDQLVTGTMTYAQDVNGVHADSSTSIVFEWQKAECVISDKGANSPPVPAKPPAK